MGPSRTRHRLHHPHPEVMPVNVETVIGFLSRRRIGKPAEAFDRAQPVRLIGIHGLQSKLPGGPIAHQIPQMAGIGQRFHASPAGL